MLLRDNRKNARIVNAVDCPMGCGKTSAAIHYINSSPPDERIIYCTPYNDECRRICDSSGEKEMQFIEESKQDGRKTTELKRHISSGNSVACTHALLSHIDNDILNGIRKYNYTLIIDEAYDVIRPARENERNKLFFLLDHGMIHTDEATGQASFVNDFESRSCSVIGSEMVNMIQSGYVFLMNKKVFVWVFPIEVLNAFKRIFIMTYLFDAQPIYYYLLCNGYRINSLGVKKYDDSTFRFCEKEFSDGFRFHAESKIHILEDEKLNRIGDEKNALSSGWYKRDKRDGGNNIKQLGRNIRNVQRNKFNCSSKDFMWTCFNQYKELMSDKNIEKSHVASNARATNTYGNRHFLAYGIGMYANPDSYTYFKSNGYTMDADKWALSVMLQWIWRSAIRNEEDIYIYIPSKRMRTLLINWMDSVSKGGVTVEAQM